MFSNDASWMTSAPFITKKLRNWCASISALHELIKGYIDCILIEKQFRDKQSHFETVSHDTILIYQTSTSHTMDIRCWWFLTRMKRVQKMMSLFSDGTLWMGEAWGKIISKSFNPSHLRKWQYPALDFQAVFANRNFGQNGICCWVRYKRCESDVFI